jgi:hypothetical protein
MSIKRKYSRKASKSVFYGTGCVNANFFSNMGSSEPSVIKKALVAVEGTFEDSVGNTHTFTKAKLDTISNHTNRALSSGTVIPVCKDHVKTVDNTVGKISGSSVVRPVTAEDLPNSSAHHLIGKNGLFFDGVAISDIDAATKVAAGTVTSVSMGLSLDPNDNRIMELSLVPIPAIPNMGLFSAPENKAISNFSDNFFSDQALTWDDLESEQTNLDDLREEFDGLTDNLWALLNNIYNNDVVSITDVSTLQQYVFTALNGFGVRVVDMLGISEMAQQEAESTNEVGTLDAAGAQAMTDSQVLGVSAGGGNVAGYKSGRLTASFRAANAKRQVRRLVAKSSLRA